MNCNQCRWFESQEIKTDRSVAGRLREFLVGICRRHSPRRFIFPNSANATSGWPTTCGHDWCGEWEKMLDDSSGTVPGRRRADWKVDQEQTQEFAE